MTITGIGAIYEPQLVHTLTGLETGKTYKMTTKIKADLNTIIDFQINRGGGEWTSYPLNASGGAGHTDADDDCSVTAEWSICSHTFTSDITDSTGVVLNLNLGIASLTTVWVDDLSVVEVDAVGHAVGGTEQVIRGDIQSGDVTMQGTGSDLWRTSDLSKMTLEVLTP
jgi:hypothetical protein